MQFACLFILLTNTHPPQNLDAQEKAKVARDLSNRFHSEERVFVEYTIQYPESEEPSAAPVAITIALDRGRTTIYSAITFRGPMGDSVNYQLVEGTTTYAWDSNGESMRWDLRPHWERIERRLGEVRRSLIPLLPKPPQFTSDLKMNQPIVAFVISGKPSKTEKGRLQLMFGFTVETNPPSWILEVTGDPRVIPVRSETNIEFTFADSKKRLVIDATSGWLREMEVADHDGRKRIVSRSKFLTPPTLPEIKRPDKSRSMLPPEHQIRSAIMARSIALDEFVKEIAEQWDTISEEARTRAIPDAVTLSVAAVADELDRYLAQSYADHKIETWMKAGVTFADLQTDTHEYAKSYARECLGAIFAEDRPFAVGGVIHRRLLEKLAPSDDRRLIPLKNMLEKAVSPEVVFPLRQAPSGKDFEQFFREALTRARRL